MTAIREKPKYKSHNPINCCTQHSDTGFKMALLLLLVMLSACAAIPHDLSGKMFTFPQETNSAHVRLTTSRQVLSAVTVCLRSFTDLRRDYSLFSLATPSFDNDILIFKKGAIDETNVYIRNAYAPFGGQHFKVNTWHSVCATWDSASGLAQLWLDGKPSSRKFLKSGSNVSGPFIIVLGQEQDSHGGGFDIKQSFVGMLSDVHMWDYALSRSEIETFPGHMITMTPGNVLNWKALEYQTIGRVLIEDIKTYG